MSETKVKINRVAKKIYTQPPYPARRIIYKAVKEFGQIDIYVLPASNDSSYITGSTVQVTGGTPSIYSHKF